MGLTSLAGNTPTWANTFLDTACMVICQQITCCSYSNARDRPNSTAVVFTVPYQ